MGHRLILPGAKNELTQDNLAADVGFNKFMIFILY